MARLSNKHPGKFPPRREGLRAGEKVIAHMHLAFTGLHGLEDEKPASLRLFLGERLLALGLSPRALLAALEIDQPKFEPQVNKASADDPKHPGWPAGTEGGRGGKFRPKDGAEAVISEEAKQRILRIALRRAIRIGGMTVLRIAVFGIGELIPGLDIAATYAAIAELVSTGLEFQKLKADVDAALAFAAHGPYSLEGLKAVGATEYQEFPNAAAFTKNPQDRNPVTRRYGPAGDGFEYHHIVTQGGVNATTFPPTMLHDTDNMIRIPSIYHDAVNAAYAAPKIGTNMTVYQWLQTQPYDVQYREGLDIIQGLNILK